MPDGPGITLAFFHANKIIVSRDYMVGKTYVYIWDMDETLILLKSLLDGTYAEAFNGLKDLQKGVEIGKMLENCILQICDDYFFYEQIESCNMPSLDSLSQFDDGRDLSDYDFQDDGLIPKCDDVDKTKLAYRHRVITMKYEQGLHKILDEEMIKHCNYLYEMTDTYTDRWLSSAREFMGECIGKNDVSSVSDDLIIDGPGNSLFDHIHVLVTSSSLIPCLVKCLLFHLDDFISPRNVVYSSWDVGKLKCFSWIKERFDSPGTEFCVVGDGLEECEAAQFMNWPFVRIDFRRGGSHRFPGLTLKMLSHYLSVVYGASEGKQAQSS